MNAWVHRVATSSVYGGLDPHVIRASWSWREVVEANRVIDAFDDAKE